ncbi:MAG: hypothetical protein HQK75_17090 [Candidatus Magnetomorum sp.]|nr:hypothetical protein [Candidatus Magnetomorum sp.]
MKKSVIIVSFFLVMMMSFGCVIIHPVWIKRPIPPESAYDEMPMPPMIPDHMLTPVEELVNTSTIINKYVKKAVVAGRKIGVMDFTTPDQLKGTGHLVADTLSIHLFKNGLEVIERQNISKIIDEQDMRAESRQDLSEEEVAKKIGKITGSDYIIFGAVTQFHFENASLPIPYTIHPDLLQKYLKQLAEYEKKVKTFLEKQQKKVKNYYQYVENDLFSQMSINDMNRGLHYNIDVTQQSSCIGSMLFPARAYRWKQYKSGQNIRWDYPYLFNKPVLPFVGVSQKWVENREKMLQHEIDAWKLSFQSLLESNDRQVSQQEYEKALPLVSMGEENAYKAYIQKSVKSEYIQKVKTFCKDVVDRLKKYDELSYQLRACRLAPVPKLESQFDFPAPATRFISIANLGFTLKIVDINTGDIIWIGQTSKRDVSVQKGLNEMASTVVRDIISIQ